MRSAYYTNAQGRPQDCFPGEGQAAEGVSGWGHHGECGARAYNGGLGHSPQSGPGAEPLDMGSGGEPGQGIRRAKPPEAESILVIRCPTEPAMIH